MTPAFTPRPDACSRRPKPKPKVERCGRWNLWGEARAFQAAPRRFPVNRPYGEQTTPYGTGARIG